MDTCSTFSLEQENSKDEEDHEEQKEATNAQNMSIDEDKKPIEEEKVQPRERGH